MMIRTMRSAHPSAAALFRFVAFVVAAMCVLLLVIDLAAAAAGRISLAEAAFSATIALATAVALTLAVRRLDPLRRS